MLQAELTLALNAGLISKVALFRHADGATTMMLVKMLRPVVFMPNEIIIREGQVSILTTTYYLLLTTYY